MCLWHWANWAFVCWGLYHATLLAIYNIFGINTRYKNVVAYERYLPNVREWLQLFLTFFLAVIGWIIFRAESITQAASYLSAMTVNLSFGPHPVYSCEGLIFGIALLFVEWFQRDKQHALQFSTQGVFKYRLVRWSVYYIILFMMMRFSGNSQTFIYFQFWNEKVPICYLLLSYSCRYFLCCNGNVGAYRTQLI